MKYSVSSPQLKFDFEHLENCLHIMEPFSLSLFRNVKDLVSFKRV